MAEKRTIEQVEADVLKLEGEGTKLHLELEAVKNKLEDLRTRRDKLLNERMDLIREQQLERMGLGLAKPNVVAVPTATLAAPKGV